MKDTKTTIQQLKEKMEVFVNERDWKQFHTPKNISMSIAIEAAELMEIFQWCTQEESYEIVKREKKEVMDEVGDIFAYLLSFCTVNDIDLSEAFENKLRLSAEKYPIEKAKGNKTKSTKYKVVDAL